jgi:hypothetical protein
VDVQGLRIRFGAYEQRGTVLKPYLLEMFGSGSWRRFNHLEGGHTYDYKGKDEICFSLAR